MAQRFGSPTGKAESGTEEEFRWALENNRANAFPEIKWFFRRIDRFVSPPDPDMVTESLEQWKKVRDFRAELKRLNVYFAEYPDVSGFKEALESDLTRWLTDRNRPWAATTPKHENEAMTAASPPQAYFETIERDFHRLDIAGIDNDRAFEIPLSEIYVSLRVIFEEEAHVQADKAQEPGIIDVQTALLRYSKLVIVGDPGSGKSTFLKFVALMLARAISQEDPSIALRKLSLQDPLPIPLFISCWDLSDFLKTQSTVEMPALLEFSAQRLSASGWPTNSTALEKLLRQGGCCLLFDGLDEVPTDNGRAVVSRLLEECVKRFSKNRFVVTSRVRAYTGDTILKGEFTRCDIQPFDADDRAQFLRNWMSLLFKIQPDKVATEGTDANRELLGLMQAIETSDRIRPLAVNPLLLTVIAIVHWNRKRLPEQRVDLYDECVDVLLGQRKEAEHIQLGRKVGALDEGREQRHREERAWIRKRFAEVALHILAGDDNHDETTKSEIIKLLIPRFIDQGATTPDQAEARASLFLDRQELRSGILVSRREGNYRFVHLTFQEYLAAWHLSNQEFEQVVPIIANRIRRQRWFETLQLLGGQWAKQSDEKLDKYLDWLLDNQGKVIAEQAPVIALCANIVKDTAGTAEVTPSTRTKFRLGVEGTLDAFRPASGIPALTQLEILEALGQLGAAVKTHLITATRSGLFQVRRRAIEMLLPHLSDDDLFGMTHILQDRSREPIKMYLSCLLGRDSTRAARTLMEVTWLGEKATEAFADLVQSFQSRLNKDLFKALALHVFDVGSSRDAAMWRDESSSQWWPSRAVLLPYFVADFFRYLKDRESCVRAKALKSLVEMRAADEALFAALVHATKDEDWDLRKHALGWLVQAFKRLSDTRNLVLRAVTQDEFYLVRVEALRLLVSIQNSDATWRFVQERAIQDPSEQAREAAIRMIAASQKELDETWHFIGQRATQDESSRTRVACMELVLRHKLTEHLDKRMASRDFDGIMPPIDPREPITSQRVSSAARRLSITVPEMYMRYQRFAAKLLNEYGMLITIDSDVLNKEQLEK